MRMLKYPAAASLSFVMGHFNTGLPANTPITPSGISPLVYLVSRDTQLPQISNLRFRLFPLLPDVHSEPAPQPFIQREYSAAWVLLHQQKSTRWHLPRKKSAKSKALLAAKILFYFIVLLTGCGSNFRCLRFCSI